MRAENSQESAEMQRRKLTGIGRNVVKKITGREEAGMDEREYYKRLAAAYLRGRAGRIGQSSTEEEEPKLYPFKRGHRELPCFPFWKSFRRQRPCPSMCCRAGWNFCRM